MSAAALRHDGRQVDQLRPLKLTRGYVSAAPGSVLIEAGRTTVLCTASVENSVPDWMAGKRRGWLTAEYSMLPGSTRPRKQRERAKIDGRTTEIQRLIGRSLRAVIDLNALGERTIYLDCDVLQADGGTRTASITGAYVALADAITSLGLTHSAAVLTSQVAAVSVGMVEGRAVLDLDYHEDHAADVDFNIVMTGKGRFVELQGTGEGNTFDDVDLAALVALGKHGIGQLLELQRTTLAS